MRGVLIGGDKEASAFERAQLLNGACSLGSKAQETFGIGEQNLTGGGKGAVPRAALKKPFAKLFLQLANGLADSGLGAAQTCGGA